MSFWSDLSFRCRVLLGKRSLEAEMAEELNEHLARLTEANLASGMTPEEARYAAQRRFGGLEQIKERAREQRGVRWLEEICRDVRHSGRTMAKQPAFTATALGILALCLGANLTIFAVIDSILLRPLPFPEPDRLVTIFNTYPKAGVDRDGASLTNYYERRGQIAAFSDIAIVHPETAIVGEPGSTERIDTARISPDFFKTLGVGLILGREFTESEMVYQADRVVILTDAYWRGKFDADPNVLGRELRMDGVEKKIIGVLPPSFRFLSSTARVFVAYSSNASERAPAQRHSGAMVTMIARLKPGFSIDQAAAEIAAQDAALAESYPQAKIIADAGFRSVVVPLHADHVRTIRPVLWLLQGGAFLLLLIGSFNLVNLLLIRASGRVREFVIRLSLGATRRHIATEVLVETVLLTFLGGAAGLALAKGGILAVTQLGADRLPLGAQVAFDLPLAWSALAGACGLGVLIAIPLAWFALRAPAAQGLHASTRGSTATRTAQSLRHGFIITQIALAFILLSGAGLLGLSLQRVAAISPGFRSGGVLVGKLTLPWKNYHGASYLPFVENVLNEMSRLPGITAASLSTKLPLNGTGAEAGKLAVTVKGHVMRPGETVSAHYAYGVIGDYFEAMGVPLRQGRLVVTEDSHRAERVCVVDEDFARRFWPKGDALGQRLFLGSTERSDGEAFAVVGVVGAVKQMDLTDNEALGTVYVPLAYRAELSLYLVTRASVPPDSLGNTLRALVRKIDPDLPLNELHSMDTQVSNSLETRRSPALLAAVFAAAALSLSAVGTYGVLAYAVSQRHREIGIRMALGALPNAVHGQFLRLGAKLLALGLALGGLGAWVASSAMQSLLFGVETGDLAIFAIAATLMTAVVLLAVLLPSRRAARISPMDALRAD